MLKANKAASISDSPGFRRMFAPDRLSLGVFFPIEAFERDEPSMRDQPGLARRAEELGFAALWTRDVPLRDPNFGDLGQVYDPWVWLGWIAAALVTPTGERQAFNFSYLSWQTGPNERVLLPRGRFPLANRIHALSRGLSCRA